MLNVLEGSVRGAEEGVPDEVRLMEDSFYLLPDNVIEKL